MSGEDDWVSVKLFLDKYEELRQDQSLMDHPDERELRPVIAAMLVLGERIERLNTRTEVECKQEIYRALGKRAPSAKELLKEV